MMQRTNARLVRGLAAATVLVGSMVVTAPPASAASDPWATLESLGFDPPTEDARAEAVRTYDAEDPSAVRRYEVEGFVEPLETVEEDAGETVVTLDSDILFRTAEYELNAEARARLGTLVEPVPEGATVTIAGHTDSVGEPADNQLLSERRAQAVADAVTAARPDLELDVAGYGETRLKQPESGDDVEADRAINRRVEIRYQS